MFGSHILLVCHPYWDSWCDIVIVMCAAIRRRRRKREYEKGEEEEEEKSNPHCFGLNNENLEICVQYSENYI